MTFISPSAATAAHSVWKLRLVVPVGASAPDILGALMERYPVLRIASRNAA